MYIARENARCCFVDCTMGQMVLIACVLFCFHGQSLAATTTIYWTDNDLNQINRVNTDGSDSQFILSTGEAPNGIDIDFANGKMYWSEYVGSQFLPDRQIQRANLDGTAESQVVTTTDSMEWPALDLANNKVYWPDVLNDRIRRSNLDGTNVETVVSGNLDSPYGIALDLVHGKMYWTDYFLQKIERSNLDGSDRELVVNASAYTLKLDIPNELIYVADFFGSRIYSVRFDGTNLTNLVLASEAPRPRAIALFEDKLYWTDDFVSNRIRRANLDGSSPETVLDLGEGKGPTGIFIHNPTVTEPEAVPEPASWVLGSTVLALLGVFAVRHRTKNNRKNLNSPAADWNDSTAMN